MVALFFVRDGLKVNSISVCEEENVEFITVELPGVVVHSMYKPPPEPFLLPPLGQRIKPHIVIGDFNSHSTLGGYTTTDSDGEAVEQWADSKQIVTHPQHETAEIIQQCNMEEGIQPETSSLYLQTFSDMCEKSVSGFQAPAHSTALSV